MSKTCRSCNHSNIDAAHYCTECGAPLERISSFNSLQKRYTVVPEAEYDQLKKDVASLRARNKSLDSTVSSLRRQLDEAKRKKIDWEKVGDIASMVFSYLLGIVGVACVIWFIVEIFQSCSGSDKDPLIVTLDKTNGKYGIWNEDTDEWTTAAAFDTVIRRNSEGSDYFVLVGDNARVGVADSSGHQTIPCSLDSVGSLSFNGVSVTYAKGKEGLIDASLGRQILPCEYLHVLWSYKPSYNTHTLSSAGTYVGNIIPAMKSISNGWILFNRKGERIGRDSFYGVSQTGEPNLIKVQKYYRSRDNRYATIDGKRKKLTGYCYGLLNAGGELVLPIQYYSISVFNEGCAWIKTEYNSPYACITNGGAIRFRLNDRNMMPDLFYYGLAAVTRNGKIGYYNKMGKLVIPFKYDRYSTGQNSWRPWSFSDGKAWVSLNGVNGRIDTAGTFTPDK